MRIISQNAYKKMRRHLREFERAAACARAAALQARREGKGRMVREELFWKYCDWKRAVSQQRQQLADCQPSETKYPDWSPAARRRNPHLTA